MTLTGAKGLQNVRYILAAVSLLIALVCLGLGIAQRTVWAPPDTITAQLEQTTESQVLLISGADLNAHDGPQNVHIAGEGPITAIVGRDHDVQGWVGESQFDTATVTAEDALQLQTTNGDQEQLPALAGSDMWVEEHSGEGELSFPIDLPQGFTIAIAGAPGQPAPSDVSVSWPYDASTPLFGPFMTAGFVFLAIALVLFLLALRSHRRRRGPQRRTHRELTRAQRRELKRDARRGLPVAPQEIESTQEPEATDAIERGSEAAAADRAAEEAGTDGADGSDADEPGTGGPDTARSGATEAGAVGGVEPPAADAERGTQRRVATRSRARRLGLIAPAMIAVVALTGCGPEYWPEAQAPTESAAEPEPTSLEDTLPPVAVTEQQFARILEDTREVVAQADEERDAELAATRLGGPVLDVREVNYEARGVDGEIDATTGIPDGDVDLLLPQQTETWPRTVMAVVAWQDDSLAQSALMFEQTTARDDYRVVYQTTLESGVEVPTVASPTIGAASLPLDSPLLQRSPDEVTSAYADVLLNGEESEYWSWFDTEQDSLNEAAGRVAKDEYAARPEYELANLEWSTADDDAQPRLLVTNEGGAIIATSFTQTQRLTPKEEGVTVSPSGSAAALLGIEESESGIVTVDAFQVLLYIPPADAPEGEQIRMLGWSQALVDAREA